MHLETCRDGVITALSPRGRSRGRFFGIDYGKMITFDGPVDYLMNRLAQS
jgi:hypothetical protein